jgi:hypothetical protein
MIIFPTGISEEQFAALDSDRRMSATMKAGDAGDPKYYEFMKWCIEVDPDPDVRFAALKRLSNFKEQNDLRLFLQRLDKSDKKLKLEPYLSMALFRVGMIGETELQSRLNGV